MIRSCNSDRSNSAKVASIPNMAQPRGVVKSRALLTETKPAPRASNSWSVVIRSDWE